MKNFTRKCFTILILCLVICLFGFYKLSQKSFSQFDVGTIEILNNEYIIDSGNILIANSQPLRTQGLSYSTEEEFSAYTGMLFMLDKPEKMGIWMKDMNYPIDIIWINEDFQMIGSLENVSPDTYPEIFYPPDVVMYVLETKAGFVKEKKLNNDTTFKIYYNKEK